jgi:cysteine desulfurase
MGNKIYLDSAAMSKPLPCAVEEYNRVLNEYFGNPSSAHEYGQRAWKALGDARSRIAKCMDCKEGEVIFVSTATEAAKLAINSCNFPNTEFTCGELEHHSVSENIPISGSYNVKTKVICQMLVNNETGNILEIPDRSKYDVWICDATSAVGHIPVSFKEIGCDYLFADGIKFGSVPGAAFLIVKRTLPIVSVFLGGGQEYGARAGTENVPAICAMAKALEWQKENMTANLLHVRNMWLNMFDTLSKEIPDCQFNGVDDLATANINPYILNVSFPGVEGSALALMLSRKGIMVSTGAACTTGDNAPSHVLMAMGLEPEVAHSTIRFTFGKSNTKEEIDGMVETLRKVVKKIRSISAIRIYKNKVEL